ncbi:MULTISPECIES: DASS family sodium-coupled anion symporter [unclassified Haladaptatus]|uniref:SLC13 family permease n=1 Tax=unclassified Haladaptatus TaxID=2622732 RepID=UPI0023E7F21C|nr:MULTISPECIES: DASS family sodium-coupled anion symporter [unclassified Haladaptatus]
MIQSGANASRRRVTLFGIAVLGTALIALAPNPEGLTIRGQYAIATMFFAGSLWITGALPLPVTALSIPVLLTAFGVYNDIDPALEGFADHLIFLFIAGFMLANALQKYNIDRRIALWLMAKMGSSARLLILAIMLATAFLSMWVSNTATTAMMTPIAVGVLTQVIGREEIQEQTDDAKAFSNMQISTLLGTAYAASVGGVGTLIGTPPNAIVAGQLKELLGYEITFFDWLVIGIPIVFVTLPLVWYLLTFHLYPPEVEDVSAARRKAAEYLAEEGALSTRGRRVAWIFGTTAFLWVLGGLDLLFEPLLPPAVFTTLFGGEGMTIFGVEGHQGLLYYVMVGLYAIPALVLADTVDWDDIVDIDWGTILLFGGGIALAGAFADTGATEWIVSGIFNELVGTNILIVIGAIVLLVIFLTEMTSNTATSAIIVPILIALGGVFAGTLGVAKPEAAIFLAVSGAIAASFAFALPVATPPNAIVFGSGHMKQEHMMKAGIVLNVVMTAVLTGLIMLLFMFVWPAVLW